jgi:hypothetical protein
MPSLLQSTCLSPTRTLRTQLFSTFGIAAFVSLFVVVFTSCLAIKRSGEDVKEYSRTLMRTQVESSLLRSSELVAEKYASRLDNVRATVQILAEAVMDRIVGYPTMEGWQDGHHVPFEDYYYARGGSGELGSSSGNNNSTEGRRRYIYPLEEPPAPLDWTVIPDGEDERVQSYAGLLSTRSASYHMPGSCEPSPDDDDDDGGPAITCTPQQNNVTTGGILPTDTHFGLYRATGDLSVFMKPLYEADPELLKIQILFVNDGAGSTLQFPAGIIPPQTDTYTSRGCGWMASMTNPHTGMPFGSNAQRLRCHKEGTAVPSRDYNSMEDGTAAFILNEDLTNGKGTPGDVVWNGPILASDDSTVILRAGKAVYDRL